MGKPEFSADVVVSTQYGVIGAGSVYGLLTVGTVASEVKVGTDTLSGRSTLTIQANPDNAGRVYFGLDNLVTSSKYAFCLDGGGGITLELDYTDAIHVFAIGSATGQKISIIEGRA
jgi:hypothetical protein